MDAILKFNDKMYEKYNDLYKNRDSSKTNHRKTPILEYTLKFHLNEYIKDICRYIELVKALQK